MKKNFEFQNPKYRKSLYRTSNGNRPKTYLDYLKGSDYSKKIKDHYVKKQRKNTKYNR